MKPRCIATDGAKGDASSSNMGRRSFVAVLTGAGLAALMPTAVDAECYAMRGDTVGADERGCDQYCMDCYSTPCQTCCCGRCIGACVCTDLVDCDVCGYRATPEAIAAWEERVNAPRAFDEDLGLILPN